MSIATYSDLKQAIVDWTNKPDVEQLTGTFIQLAEARFNRELRTLQQIARKTASVADQYVALPGDWLEARNIQIGTRVLRYVIPEHADTLRDQNVAGDTRFYTIVGTQLELLPTPGGAVTVEMAYYKAVPALSDQATTNWLLTRAPDLYLFASLIQASALLETDARVPMWETMTQQIIGTLNAEAQRSQASGSTLVSRARAFG